MEGVSVKKGAGLIEEEIGLLQISLRDYKQLVETTRAETVSMENQISLSTDDTPKSILPEIEELFLDLTKAVKAQKDLNEHLEKQITGLKKEKSVMEQHVVASNTRCAILENSVGLPSVSNEYRLK